MSDTIECIEGEQQAVEGDELAFVVRYLGTEAITNPTVAVYKGSTPVTSTLIPSGSASVVGQTIILPTIIIPASPYSLYVVAVTADYDGLARTGKIRIACQKASA